MKYRVWSPLAFACCAALLLLSGCGPRSTPPTPPAVATPLPSTTVEAPAAPPVTIAPPLAMTGYQPVEKQPLTVDVPTYAADPDRQLYEMPGPGIRPPQGLDANTDAATVLGQLAANLTPSSKGDDPAGVNASLVGVMEGNRYVYLLGTMPKNGEDSNLVWMLEPQATGWKATPICNHSWRWVWSGTLKQQTNPVVICATVEGSGAVMTLSAYKAGQQVLLAKGLEESSLRIVPQGDQPPIIVAYGVQRWLDHKLEPAVEERYTFTWDGNAYVPKYERLADWRYHLARFVQFTAAGKPDVAAAEMAAPPAEGYVPYLLKNAPDLKAETFQTMTTQGHLSATNGKVTRAWLHRARADEAPWFWFDFDQDGKITAFGEQAEEPKS